jgi:amidase
LGVETYIGGSIESLIFYQANLCFSDGGKDELEAMAASGEPLRPLTEHTFLPPTQGDGNPHVQTHSINSMWASIVKRDSYGASYAEV